jgi:hypothetical protein
MFDLIAKQEDSSVHDIEKALASLPTGRKELKTIYVAYFQELANAPSIITSIKISPTR